RIREPELHRPYRVPGGVIGTVILGIPPAILMVLAGIRNHGERIGPVSGLAVGIGLVLLGPVLYLVSERVTRKPRPRI
ncbi:MAG TPA: hypothetical protein VFO34_03970, partial [Candidatus Acidoferrales bacterium]|nr:hypothetical protein [Candidatus Acidoferrales bacterium]